MDMQNKTLFKQAMTDPDKIFKDPLDVAEDKRFSSDEKLKILESWTVDAEGLMRAEAENMESDKQVGSGVKLLERINKAKIQIES